MAVSNRRSWFSRVARRVPNFDLPHRVHSYFLMAWDSEHLTLYGAAPSSAQDRLGIKMYSATAIARISIIIFVSFMTFPSRLLPKYLRPALPWCHSLAHSWQRRAA